MAFQISILSLCGEHVDVIGLTLAKMRHSQPHESNGRRPALCVTNSLYLFAQTSLESLRKPG